MKRNIFLAILLTIVFCVPIFAQSPTPQSTPAMVTPEAHKIIDANTPEPLPQEPAAKREITDAQDANLKGKVKTIISESKGRGRQTRDILTG